MSIEAKTVLLREVEKSLADVLTLSNMSMVMSTLSEKLDYYKLERVAFDPDSTDDLLSAYLSALFIEGKSEKTIERYKYIISKMMHTVKVPTRSITVYHLRNYISSEKDRGISDRTLEGIRQVFSAYFNWLQREGLIASNPTANLGTIKYQKKEKDVYSEADMERMKFGCKSIRDRAIICFLKATGCRISEMTQLNKDDIDFINAEVTVLGKGNKERVVFLDQVAIMTLQAYINQRKDNNEALFVGRGGERITSQGVRAMLSKLGANSNVEHVHPHKFRRTTATNLIRHGMPIQEVAAILGHDKLDTTMQYVVLDKTDIKNAYRKYA